MLTVLWVKITIGKIKIQTSKNTNIQTEHIFHPRLTQMHRYTRAEQKHAHRRHSNHEPRTSLGHFYWTQCSCGIMGWNVRHGLLAEVWHYVVSSLARKQSYVAVIRRLGQTAEHFYAAVLKWVQLLGRFITLEDKMQKVHLLWKRMDLCTLNGSVAYQNNDWWSPQLKWLQL